MVGLFYHLSLLVHPERIIVLRTAGFRRGKAVADLKAFDRSDGKDRLCQIRIQLVKNRLSETCGKIGNHTLYYAADRVTLCHFLFQILSGFFCRIRIRHAQLIILCLVQIKFFRIRLYRTDRPRISVYGNIKALQKLFCNRSGCNAPYGLPCGRAAAAAVIPKAELLIKGIIRMARPVTAGDHRVILRSLIFIPYHHGDRCSRGLSLEDAGKDLHLIAFASLSCKFALSRFSPVQKFLDISLTKRQPRRAAIDHYADGFPVGLPPGRHFK